jgi:hypothetical protein
MWLVGCITSVYDCVLGFAKELGVEAIVSPRAEPMMQP